MSQEYKADIVIESRFLGITVDKEYFKDKSNKLVVWFENIRLHIKLNDYELKKFKEGVLFLD